MASTVLLPPPFGVPAIDPLTGTLSEPWRRYYLSIGQGFADDVPPIDGRYWVATFTPGLTNEVNLGALPSGYLTLSTTLGNGTPSTVATIPAGDLTPGGTLPVLDGSNLTNLTVTLADLPAHALTHQVGGTDPLSVGLLGGYPGGTTTFLRGDGTFAAPPAGGAPGGAVSQVQFHDAGGVFGGHALFVFDKANARVGIGLGAPTFRLDVAETAAAMPAIVRVRHLDNTNGGSHAIVSVGGGGPAGGDAYTQYSVTGGVTIWSVGLDTSDGEKFKVASSPGPGVNDRLVIMPTGHVGVGTGTPGVKLDVLHEVAGANADLRVRHTDAGNVNSNAVAILATGGPAGGDPYVQYQVSGAAVWSVGIDNSDLDKFKFSTGATPGAGLDALVLEPSGNVTVCTVAGNLGVGTSAPGRRLHVQGQDPGIRLQNSGPGTYSWALVNGLMAANDGRLALFDETAGQARLAIDTSGNVGISVSSPGARLDVSSPVAAVARFDSTAGSGGFVKLSHANTDYGYFGSSAVVLGFGSTADLAIWTNQVLRLWSGNNAVQIQAAYDRTTANPPNMYVHSDGLLHRSTSSLRYKTAVRPLDDWRWLLALQPITFTDRAATGGRRFGGLAAEDVARHGPRGEDGTPIFAGLDRDGRPDDVAYAHLAAPLVAAIQAFDARLAALEGQA